MFQLAGSEGRGRGGAPTPSGHQHVARLHMFRWRELGPWPHLAAGAAADTTRYGSVIAAGQIWGGSCHSGFHTFAFAPSSVHVHLFYSR